MSPARGKGKPSDPTGYAHLGPRARALCQWLADRNFDFRAAAAERGVEPAGLYREWLEVLDWNQSLAARIYRRPGLGGAVTRQAIEAQMRSFGVKRPPNVMRSLEGQGVEGGLSALRDAHSFIRTATSRERLCCEQLLELASTWQRLRSHERARAALVDVVRLARYIGDPEIVARAIRPLSYSAFQVSRYGTYDREAVDQLDDWIPMLRESGARAPLALALAHLAFELMVSRDPAERDRGRRSIGEALPLAEASGDVECRTIVKGFATALRSGPDDLDARLALLAPEIEHAEELDVDARFTLLYTHLADLVEAARFEEADTIVDRLRGLEADCSAPWPERPRAVLAVMRGEWSKSRQLSTPRAGAPLESAAQILGLLQYDSMLLRGEWDELETATRWSSNDNPGALMERLMLARVLSLQGRGEEVRADFEEWARDDFSLVRRDLMYLANLCMLADLAHELDDPTQAEALHERLSPYRDRIVVIRVVAAARNPVAHALARLSTTLGEWKRASAEFEQARLLARRARAGPWLAWIEYDHAGMLVRAGDVEDAQRAGRLAEDAAALARSLGMSWLARRAAEVASSE